MSKISVVNLERFTPRCRTAFFAFYFLPFLRIIVNDPFDLWLYRYGCTYIEMCYFEWRGKIFFSHHRRVIYIYIYTHDDYCFLQKQKRYIKIRFTFSLLFRSTMYLLDRLSRFWVFAFFNTLNFNIILLIIFRIVRCLFVKKNKLSKRNFRNKIILLFIKYFYIMFIDKINK